ncbi:MAG: YceI family protein [Bacteroidota bacterium]
MKRFFILLSFAALFAACGGPEGEAVASTDAVDEAAGKTELVAAAQYNVDPAASSINWEGTKVAYGHVGTVPVTNGQLMVAEGELKGGQFSIDLREIKNTDIEDAEKSAKLVGHLHSEDFFDVANHPMAEFTITQIQAAAEGEEYTHDITGNLTLRGESRSITIPATVSMEGGQLKANTPKFTIDRTEWGVTYKNSGIEGIVKDEIINDNIGLEIMLVANK